MDQNTHFTEHKASAQNNARMQSELLDLATE